ncbi:hypothetical protein BH11BAC1_BH11BAC1_25220 [soil metagenome]
MKKKIIILLSACFIVFSYNSNAQVRMRMGVGMRVPMNGARRMPASPEQRTEREVQKLKQELNMESTQTKEVRTLFQQRDIARRNKDKAALKNLRVRDRMQEILTPEQYGKYIAMKQEKNASKSTRQNNPPAEEEKTPPPAKAVEQDDVYN